MLINQVRFLFLISIVKLSNIEASENYIPENKKNQGSVNETSATEESNETKISGGYVGDPTLWGKFVVSIRKAAKEQQEFGSGHFCGGVIISPNAILTASHCVYSHLVESKGKKPNVFVVAGASQLFSYTKSAQVITIKDMILHAQYDAFTHHNDIALLILERKIIMDGKTTALVKLPNHPPRPLTKCTAAGWGSVYYNGPRSNKLLYADLSLLTNEDCQNDYPTKAEYEICATSPTDISVDTCQGDSGGPLFCDGAITGVVSRGGPCGINNISGLYTGVYYYLDWVKSEMNHAPMAYSNLYLFVYILCILFWSRYDNDISNTVNIVL